MKKPQKVKILSCVSPACTKDALMNDPDPHILSVLFIPHTQTHTLWSLCYPQQVLAGVAEWNLSGERLPGGQPGVGARLRPDVADAGTSQQDRDPLIGSARLTAQQYIDNNATKTAQSTGGFANIREKKRHHCSHCANLLIQVLFLSDSTSLCLEICFLKFIWMCSKKCLSGQSKNKNTFFTHRGFTGKQQEFQVVFKYKNV